MIRVLVVFLSVIFLISCAKEPGEGGSSTIYGSVWVSDYNDDFTILEREYFGADEDIYIVYGDNFGYNDRVKTDYLGMYQFKYLRPGTYTIYAYSKDSTQLSLSGKTPIVIEVSITDRKQSIHAPEIRILK